MRTHASSGHFNFFPSLFVPQQLLPWLDSAARERHSSLLKILYLFSHSYLITGICFCRWWFSSFYFCPRVNIWLFCTYKFFKFQFSGVRNWLGSVAGRAHPAQSRASSFFLLEWGPEKEALHESCQTFEVATAQTSGLVNLVLSHHIGFFECKHPFIDLNRWS